MKALKIIPSFVKDLLSGLSRQRRLYLGSFTVGLLSALAAALMKNAVHFTAGFVAEHLNPGKGILFYFIIPPAGLILTYLFVKYVVKDNISHGVSRVLQSFARGKSYLKSHNIWTPIVASSITIGFGGSVGAEAPIVLSGSAIGSNIGRKLGLSYRYITLLAGCGAAGAIAGIFKAPVAGIIFAIEVLMLDMTLSSIVPLLISTVTASTIAWLLMGNSVLLSCTIKDTFLLKDLPWYLVLGIFTGLVAVWFSKVTLFTEKVFKLVENHTTRIAIGSVVLGSLIVLFPPFFGEGYTTIMGILKGDYSLLSTVFTGFFHNTWFYLLFITGCMIILKVVATTSTNSAGGVGGVFAPTLFTGAIAGLFAALILGKLSNSEIPVASFVLAGMAGLMAGVMHAPLTAIFLIVEITGGYDLLIPLIITSTIAFITSHRFTRYSVYHIQLAARGELVTHDKDKAILAIMDWTEEIENDLITINPEATLGDLVKIISKSKRNIFPVVDEYGVFEGVVMLDDVREIMFDSGSYDKITMRDIMQIPPSYIDISESLKVVMDTFEQTGAWNLPVLDKGLYAGYISRSRIYSAYRDMLIKQFSEE
ncbi:MAG TPA: chloride channel protein [Bacteroidales bacterium]|nr:chloride channel protein [Bacteroidales bacterium]HRT90132.1 chloride channel protein [Bacteroidales bacterium]